MYTTSDGKWIGYVETDTYRSPVEYHTCTECGVDVHVYQLGVHEEWHSRLAPPPEV